MYKIAAAENSKVNDSQTGKPIYITTSARKAFRAANPEWAKVRNILLNVAIATDFSKAKTQAKQFKPKNEPQSIGQVRNTSVGRYIAIINNQMVRIVSVAGGAPRLSAPPKAPTPVNLPGSETPSPVKMSPEPVTLSKYNNFFFKHATADLANQLNISDTDLDNIVTAISSRFAMSKDQALNKLLKFKNKLELKPYIRNILNNLNPILIDSEHATAPYSQNSQMYNTNYEPQSSIPAAPFAVQAPTVMAT